MPGETKSSPSTSPKYSFLSAKRALPLQDEAYFYYLLDRISKARRSILGAVFIIDVQPSQQGELVAELIRQVARAHWLGLDVRIVVGHSEATAEIDVADRVSLAYLRSLRVPARKAQPRRRSSLHSKYLILDRREVVVGSHNWAYFDLFASHQTSVALYSPHLARRLTRRFEELWAASAEAGE